MGLDALLDARDVAVVERHGRDERARLAAERHQAVAIQLRHHATAALAREPLALADRPALAGADAQHHQLVPARAPLRRERGHLRLRDAVGHEQDRPRNGLLREQRLGERERARLVLAGHGHQARSERLQVGLEDLPVLRERQHRVRGAGVHDEPASRSFAQGEQVAQLLLGTLEPRRLDVDRVHAAREVERDHQRGLVPRERRSLALPGRARERERRRGEEHGQQVHRPNREAASDAHQQVWQQVRRHDTPERPDRILAALQQEDDQRRRQREPEPLRAQEVELGRREAGAHARASEQGARSASSADRTRAAACIAAPSGQ